MAAATLPESYYRFTINQAHASFVALPEQQQKTLTLLAGYGPIERRHVAWNPQRGGGAGLMGGSAVATGANGYAISVGRPLFLPFDRLLAMEPGLRDQFVDLLRKGRVLAHFINRTPTVFPALPAVTYQEFASGLVDPKLLVATILGNGVPQIAPVDEDEFLHLPVTDASEIFIDAVIAGGTAVFTVSLYYWNGVEVVPGTVYAGLTATTRIAHNPNYQWLCVRITAVAAGAGDSCLVRVGWRQNTRA